VTWSQLRALWDERDHRYRTRREPVTHRALQISASEATAIREYRRTEVATLPPATRARALLELNRWLPPIIR
jgi:hypothetical protein